MVSDPLFNHIIITKDCRVGLKVMVRSADVLRRLSNNGVWINGKQKVIDQSYDEGGYLIIGKFGGGRNCRIESKGHSVIGVFKGKQIAGVEYFDSTNYSEYTCYERNTLSFFNISENRVQQTSEWTISGEGYEPGSDDWKESTNRKESRGQYTFI